MSATPLAGSYGEPVLSALHDIIETSTDQHAIAMARAAVAKAEELIAERDELLAVVRDIRLGAAMMLDSPLLKSIHGYAKEVKRVADAALVRS